MPQGPILRQVRHDARGSLGCGSLLALVAIAVSVFTFQAPYPSFCPIAGVSLLALGAIFLLANGARWMVRPEEHWLLCGLREHGGTLDVVRTIDAEWSHPETRILGSLTNWPAWVIDATTSFVVLTQNWLLRVRPGLFQSLPLSRIVWIYKQITANRATIAAKPYFYGVGFRRDDGRTTLVELDRESDADMVLEIILQRRPELPVGYIGEWVGAGSSTGQLRQARDDRKKMLESLADDEREAWMNDRLDEALRFPRRVDPLNPETGR